jgi:hypothetical protein
MSLIDGLAKTAELYGWEDTSIPPTLRAATRRRTTLRCAAGLTLSVGAGIGIPTELISHAVSLVERYVLNTLATELDSPDYACAVVALVSAYDADLNRCLPAALTHANLRSDRNKEGWASEIWALLEQWRKLAGLNIPGYSEVVREYEDKLHMLT